MYELERNRELNHHRKRKDQEKGKRGSSVVKK